MVLVKAYKLTDLNTMSVHLVFISYSARWLAHILSSPLQNSIYITLAKVIFNSENISEKPINLGTTMGTLCVNYFLKYY